MDPIIATIPAEQQARYVGLIKRIGRAYGNEKQAIEPVLTPYLMALEAELAGNPLLDALIKDHDPDAETLALQEQAQAQFMAEFEIRYPGFNAIQAAAEAVEANYWGDPIDALRAAFIKEGGNDRQFSALINAVLGGEFSSQKTQEIPLAFFPTSP